LKSNEDGCDFSREAGLGYLGVVQSDERAAEVSQVASLDRSDAGAEPRWLSRAEQEAWLAVSMMMLQLPGAIDAQLQRDSGISMFEYFVLSRLSMAPDGTARMSELAHLVNGSLSRLSNVAKRLESQGWLTRTPDPTDGRYTVARLTPEGRQVVVASAPGHVETVRRLLIDPLTTSQVRTLAAIGRRLGAVVDP
jgi:DNA-binding MarR family transcriptional regulator